RDQQQQSHRAEQQQRRRSDVADHEVVTKRDQLDADVSVVIRKITFEAGGDGVHVSGGGFEGDAWLQPSENEEISVGVVRRGILRRRQQRVVGYRPVRGNP